MSSVYVRQLKSGEKINVHIAVEETPERFNVYMSNESLWMYENAPDKENQGDVAHTLSDFLEDEAKRKEFENGMTFGIAIKKGSGPLGTDFS